MLLLWVNTKKNLQKINHEIDLEKKKEFLLRMNAINMDKTVISRIVDHTRTMKLCVNLWFIQNKIVFFSLQIKKWCFINRVAVNTFGFAQPIFFSKISMCFKKNLHLLFWFEINSIHNELKMSPKQAIYWIRIRNYYSIFDK